MSDGWNEVVNASESAQAFARQVVDALKSTGSLKSRAILIYRCENRKRQCALLYVYSINGIRIVHQPRYKLSDEVNRRESVQAAREKHTEDGNRRWKEDTFPLSLAKGLLSLECDHCRSRVDVTTIESDLAAATRTPTTITLKNGTVR